MSGGSQSLATVTNGNFNFVYDGYLCVQRIHGETETRTCLIWCSSPKILQKTDLPPGRHAQIRDTLAQSPTMAELWPELEPRCVGVPIVAHNIGTERTMLTKSAPLHQFGPWVDTLALIRRVYPGLHSKALNDVVTALNLQSRLNELCPRAPHDALYDAFACAVLLEWLLSQPGWEQLPLRAVIA